ncbi:MAG: TIR domain-containing protein [Clostridia bacterium]|nr:TIR domain-containing protein [Clostridia bacterium]
MEAPYVFISYSTKDQKYADLINKTLQDNGLNTWIATHDLHGGESFANKITTAVNGCKAFIFVLSANSDDSPHCGNELSLAFSARKKIIPFRLHEFKLSESNTYFLQQAQWIDFFRDEGSALAELVDKVKLAFDEKEESRAKVTIKTNEEKKIDNLLKRAYLSLEVGDYKDASKFAEEILNLNMEFAEAYLIKLFSELQVKQLGDIESAPNYLNSYENFKFAKRFADTELLKILINLENENEKFVIYVQSKKATERPFDLEIVRNRLESIRGYKDVDQFIEELPGLHRMRQKEYKKIKNKTTYYNQTTIEQPQKVSYQQTNNQSQQDEKKRKTRNSYLWIFVAVIAFWVIVVPSCAACLSAL